MKLEEMEGDDDDVGEAKELSDPEYDAESEREDDKVVAEGEVEPELVKDEVGVFELEWDEV